jgi:predicted lysophospholipase L1 biosynthesis ABC-type transport system permease subunit
LWPGQNALGKKLRLFERHHEPFTVVGVVGDVRQRLHLAPWPEMYVSLAQIGWETPMYVLARARSGDPLALATSARGAVWSVDANVPITQVRAMTDVVNNASGSTRFSAALLGGFAALALLLGAMGVYGVTAYTVARRIPEFGVRLALGASRRAVLGAAAARSILPVVLGIAGGSVAASALGRLLSSMLYEVTPRDPATLTAVVSLLALVALAAMALPAWRATRVDPATVLRAE